VIRFAIVQVINQNDTYMMREIIFIERFKHPLFKAIFETTQNMKILL